MRASALLLCCAATVARADNRATHVFQSIDSRESILTPASETFQCDGTKSFPLRVRGWLTFSGVDFGGEGEAHYTLIPDLDWARQQNIPPQVLLRIGNLALAAGDQPAEYNDGSWWAMAARVAINVEANGWFASRQGGDVKMLVCKANAPPTGWIPYSQSDDLRFPFVPERPNPNGARLDDGKEHYVEIGGSLVADSPHCFGETNIPRKHFLSYWSMDHCTGHGAYGAQGRWIEIHPVDSITVLPDRPRTENVYLIAIASPYDDHSWSVTLRPPEATRPTGAARAKLIDILQLTKSDGVTVKSPESTADGVTVGAVVPHPFGGSEIIRSDYSAIVRVGWAQDCTPLTQCRNRCINTNTDPHNCGKCGASCKESQKCSGGQCVSKCTGGHWCECAGGCIKNGLDCPPCGDDAHARTSCEEGQALCSGRCFALASTHQHCGTCTHACAPPETCTAGTCEFKCAAGKKPCTCTADGSPECMTTVACTTACRKDSMRKALGGH